MKVCGVRDVRLHTKWSRECCGVGGKFRKNAGSKKGMHQEYSGSKSGLKRVYSCVEENKSLNKYRVEIESGFTKLK